MYNISFLEKSYKKFINKLSDWIPEGIYSIDLKLLHHFDLLHFQPGKMPHQKTILERDFHLIQSSQTKTLVNKDYIIWISLENSDIFTSLLIARNRGKKEPKLEAAFIASGIYNSQRLFLPLLEKFLEEYEETETLLKKYQEIDSN